MNRAYVDKYGPNMLVTNLKSMMNAKFSLVLPMPQERAHQDDSNDTPQSVCEFQVGFPLLRIKAYPGLS